MSRFSIFSRKSFVSVPKNFVEEPFSVSRISGIENFYASEGYGVMPRFSIFCRNFFVSVPKNFVGELFCAVFQKIYGREKVYG